MHQREELGRCLTCFICRFRCLMTKSQSQNSFPKRVLVVLVLRKKKPRIRDTFFLLGTYKHKHFCWAHINTHISVGHIQTQTFLLGTYKHKHFCWAHTNTNKYQVYCEERTLLGWRPCGNIIYLYTFSFKPVRFYGILKSCRL